MAYPHANHGDTLSVILKQSGLNGVATVGSVPTNNYILKDKRMDKISQAKTARLQQLIKRKDKVLPVFHPPSAALGRIMEKAGVECGFVGTSGVVGTYTGVSDVGTASMTECVQIGGWIAQSVNYPIILDGDTGHGGIMAVRRLIRECINAGIAGIRIDDQPIEGKRKTGTAGVEVVPIEQAIARYRAAVDMKNELDPNFVIMAQCYAGNAANSSFDDTLVRLKAYAEDAKVDWVQLEYPRSVEEIKKAKVAAGKAAFSFMKGGMGRHVSLKEHMDLGVNIAWYPRIMHQVSWNSLWRFLQDFNKREMHAYEDFLKEHEKDGCPDPLEVGPEGEGLDKQRELEERYFSADMLNKYRKA
jgi:2-methylisocitrate lyase-like PEP mutase family enzyme